MSVLWVLGIIHLEEKWFRVATYRSATGCAWPRETSWEFLLEGNVPQNVLDHEY